MDYSKFGYKTPEPERVKAVVDRLVEGGVDKLYAQSVVAISGSESGFNWSTDPLPEAEAVIPCPSPTTIVGLEPKNGDYAKMQLINGFSTAGARKRALAGGLVTQEAGPDGPVYYATAAKAGNGRGQHQLFQLALLYRDTNLAKGFSIGPTQMYLLYSKALGGADPDRGSSWEDLYQLYLCADPVAIFTRLRYTNKPPFPAGNPGDRGAAINWLRRICQAGCSEENARKYYDSYYSNNLKKVLKYTA